MAEENQNNHQLSEDRAEIPPARDSVDEAQPQHEEVSSKKTWFVTAVLATLLVVLIVPFVVWGVLRLQANPEFSWTSLVAIPIYATGTAVVLFTIAFLVQRRYGKPHKAYLNYWLGLVLLLLDAMWAWLIIRSMRQSEDFTWTGSRAVAVYVSAAIVGFLAMVFTAWMRRSIRLWKLQQRERGKKKTRFNPKPLTYALCTVLLGVIAWMTWAALERMQARAQEQTLNKIEALKDTGAFSRMQPLEQMEAIERIQQATKFRWNCPQAVALYFGVGILGFGILAFMLLMRRATTRWEMEIRLSEEHESWLVVFNWTKKILHVPTIVCSFPAALIVWYFPAKAELIGLSWFCVWLFCHTIEDYDFSFAVSIAIGASIFLFVVLTVFGGVIDDMYDYAKLISIFASPALYLGFGLAYLTSILVSYIRGLFHYVAITPNQMIIQSRIGEDGETIQRRKYDAQIEAATDVVEWYVYNAGSLKIWFHEGRREPMSFYVSGIRKKSRWLFDVLEVTSIETAR
jgi:hypothetical protein